MSTKHARGRRTERRALARKLARAQARYFEVPRQQWRDMPPWIRGTARPRIVCPNPYDPDTWTVNW